MIAGAPPDGSPPRRRLIAVTRPAIPVLAVVILYCLLALLAYWPVSPLASGQLYGPPMGDPTQTTWFLAWTPFALLHGHNPFFSDYLDYPSGVNLATNTLKSALGLLGSPVTLTLGPLAAANFLMRLAFAASATSMCLVLRRWTTWWPAAFCGGLLYGFGSYMSAQGGAHLGLVFVAVPPLLLWCLDELLVIQRRSPARVGLLLGLLCAAQFLIMPEVLADCVVVGAAAVLALALWHRSQVVSRARRAGPGLATAAASFALVCGYPIWCLVTGPGHVIGPIAPPWLYSQQHADLLSLIERHIVVNLTLAGGAPYLSSLGKPMTFIDTQNYLGLPLTAVTLVSVLVLRRLGIIRVASIVALTSFVLSLGPHLNVGGATTGIPLPGIVLTHLPLLDNTIWDRYGLEVGLSASIVLAVGLDRLVQWLGQAVAPPSDIARRWRPHPPTWVRRLGPSRAAPGAPAAGGAPSTSCEPPAGPARSPGDRRLTRSFGPPLVGLAVAAASLAPLLGGYPIASSPVTWPGQLVSSLRASVPAGGVVLAFPYVVSDTDAPMAWQAIDQMGFRLVGGYATVPAPTGGGSYHVAAPAALARVDQAIKNASTGSLGSTLSRAVGAAQGACNALPGVLREFAVDAVVVWPTGADPSLVSDLLEPVLGVPSRHFTQALVWYDVPHDLTLQAECGSAHLRHLLGSAAVAAPGFSLTAWTVPSGARTVVTTTPAPNGGTAPLFAAVSGRSLFTFVELTYDKPQDWSNQPDLYLAYRGTGSGKAYRVTFIFAKSGAQSTAGYRIVDDSSQWQTAAFPTANPGIPASDWSHVIGVSVSLPSKAETGTIALGVPVLSPP